MEELTAQLMINAFEEHEMEIFYVSGSYLNAYMPEDNFYC